MLAFLGMLPVIGSIVQGITAAFFNAKVSLVQARVGGDRDVAVKLVQAAAAQEHESTSKLATFASSKLLTLLIIGFATPFVIFTWKIVCVDIVIGPGCIWWTNLCWVGNTEPIRGQVSDWATTIIGFLFGSATVTTVGRMWFGRSKEGE